MFELYETDKFKENIKNGNFIEISMLNRYKDFKSIKIFLGINYKDIFIPYENKVYKGCSKKITLEDTISYFYNIDKNTIMLSTYKTKNNIYIKKLEKIVKYSWKELYINTKWIKINFLHL
jgi:hypothetical protein